MTRTANSLLLGACAAVGIAALISLLAVPHPARAGKGDKDNKNAPPVNLLVTGRAITPRAEIHTGVGSYPFHAVPSPDGRFALVSDIGARAYLSVVDVRTGTLVSQLKFVPGNRAPGDRRPNEGLYYGMAFGTAGADGATPIYVSRGSEDKIGVLSLAASGTLSDTGRFITYPAPVDTAKRASANNPAGLATSADGKYLYAVDNTGLPDAAMQGALHVFDTATGKEVAYLHVPGYPYAVAAVTKGANAGKRLYITSEAQGCVASIDVSDPAAPRVVSTINTGTDPAYLVLNRDQTKLFVSNADSDTVTVLNTATEQIERTFLLRPAAARGLPGTTPLGMALSADESRLFVALADMNAVAVVNLGTGTVDGYIPTGWYPTDIVAAPDGENLIVTCARGVQTRNPNGKDVPVAQTDFPKRAQYVYNIIEGTASRIALPAALRDLPALSEQVLTNNALNRRGDLVTAAKNALSVPGIKHVVYIIKENRTFDQVLGDMPTANGDKSLVLFGRDVTPNQHALAERFALLDNFYCCAEVSGDGWNWSTAGMASEYVSRNVPYSYSHQRPYDFEGSNNDVTVDRVGMPDVAREPGGYLWDAAARAGVPVRNYGFFVTYDGADPLTPEGRKNELAGITSGKQIGALNALAPNTDPDYREFDMNYPDSDAGAQPGVSLAPTTIKAFGAAKSPSRVSEFLREYSGYVKNNNLPGLLMVRLPRDHTSGTRAGVASPRAMVADNDYAIGQLVGAISRSPYWKETAIFIVEDDAQNGYDHLDAHRSIAFVVSPFVQRGIHDSRFYNTDSTLHTMECLLGLDPMTQYDAIAPTINVFTDKPRNDAPYSAILPAPAILSEINAATAYRAKDSERLLNPLREESYADEQLNDILWRDAHGANAPLPAKHYGVRAFGKGVGRKRDGDD